MKGGEIVSRSGDGDERGEGVGEGRCCRLRGIGMVWEKQGNIGMCGVWGCGGV